MLSTVWLSLAVAMPGRLKSSNGTVSPAASVSFTLQGDEVSSKGGQLSDQSACVYVYIYIYTIIYLQAGGFAVGKQVVTWSIYLCFVGRNGRRRIFAQNWVGLIFARFRSLTMLRD